MSQNNSQVKKPRPHVWRSGPDEYRHSMYQPWLKARAQANFRGEDWQLSFDDFYNLWNGHWHLRGRKRESLCMSRRVSDGAWSVENTILMTILEHRGKLGRESTGKIRRQREPRAPKSIYKKMVVTHG